MLCYIHNLKIIIYDNYDVVMNVASCSSYNPIRPASRFWSMENLSLHVHHQTIPPQSVLYMYYTFTIHQKDERTP